MTEDPSVCVDDDVPDHVLEAQMRQWEAEHAPARTVAADDAPPPHNTEAEQSLLGAALLSNEARDVLATLAPGDFYGPNHQTIAAAILALASRGDAVDVVTVADELNQRGQLEVVGGGHALLDLQAGTPATSSAKRYAEIIRRCATQRRVATMGLELAVAAKAHDADPDRLLSRILAFTDAVETDRDGGWGPADLAPILNGEVEDELPEILPVEGAAPLFYRSRVNGLFGASGGGKTWVTIAAMIDELNAGGSVAIVDHEDTANAIVRRLLAAGADPEAIAERVAYIKPPGPWNATAQAAMDRLIKDRGVTLFVLDSVGEAMAVDGVKGNDDDDVARWIVSCAKFVSSRGPAVILIDHLPKDDSAAPLAQIGSQRKKAATDGSLYRVDAIKSPTRTQDGVLKLTTAKDKHGTRAMGEVAGEFHLTHSGGTLTLAMKAKASVKDDHGDVRPTVLMERVSRHLEANANQSGRQIEKAVRGKAEYVRKALGCLVAEGYAIGSPEGKGFVYSSARPFRQADDEAATTAAEAVVVAHFGADEPPLEDPPSDYLDF